MGITLAKCCYGDADLGANCCLTRGVEMAGYVRCRVYDWEECPFGKKVEGCGTCAHASAMTEGDDGARMVDCDANEMQMYAPYAAACKHWEKALG